jgi:hypothetical protein
MAVQNKKERVVKRTSQGGKAKTSSMNKTQKKAYKQYRLK